MVLVSYRAEGKKPNCFAMKLFLTIYKTVTGVFSTAEREKVALIAAAPIASFALP